MKHWRLIAVWALVAVSGAASHATAQYKAEFKNSLVVGPTGPWGEAAVKFADLLKERTQGRINVVNYFDGRLFAGKQTTEFKLLDQGVADFAMGSTINWSPQVKELNLFSMPFLFPSYKALDAVEEGEPGQRLWKLIEAKGVIPLAWGENGFRDLTNSKRAVHTPAGPRPPQGPRGRIADLHADLPRARRQPGEHELEQGPDGAPAGHRRRAGEPGGLRHRAVQALDRAEAHHPLAVRDRPAHPRGFEDHLGRHSRPPTARS